jgi:hypothetical protein
MRMDQFVVVKYVEGVKQILLKHSLLLYQVLIWHQLQQIVELVPEQLEY